AASEQQKWTDLEYQFGSESCMQKLGLELDAECAKTGASGVETVDFHACKMGCKVDTRAGFCNSISNMPDGTPCGFSGEV
ncbi:unnamed protein product, partial [Ixodes hexagonus]